MREDILIVGGGIAGLTLALCLHRERDRVPRLRAIAGVSSARCRHQHPPSRFGGARAARPWRRARASIDPDAGGRVLQPLRPAHLSRAAWTRRGLRSIRSTPSIAHACTTCCSPRSRSAWAATPWSRGGSARRSSRMQRPRRRTSSTRTATLWKPSTAPPSSPATDCIRRYARRSIRAKGRRFIPASTCGAASASGPPSSPAQA